MVAHAKMPFVTLEEYFEREDAAETKSEYYNGEIVAMTGATTPHVRITSKLMRLLDEQLDGQSCEAFDSDMRVYVEECNASFYPDRTVVCDTPQFLNTPLATLLNPILIVEVLSASTERIDRGYKFDCYRTIPSLAAYVLVSQWEPRIEVFTRQEDGSWRFDVVRRLDASIALPAINCALRLAEVYARVVFPPVITSSETETRAEGGAGQHR